MNSISPALQARLATSGLALALAASFPMPAEAQSNSGAVVVTGSREPQPIDRVASDVVVIDAERIRNSSADSIEDLLRRETGVQVVRNGGPGQNASVLIRGAGAGNTVVLVDGVRVGSATLGQVEFEAIGLSQIERIEVLRGPGSSLYGADAVGGVIQIFTRRGERGLRFNAHAAVGGYGSREGDVGMSGAQAGFDYALALGHQRSEGVSTLKPGDTFNNYNPDRDGYRRTTGQLKLGFTPAEGHRIGLSVIESRLESQFDSSEYLPPEFSQDNTADFRNELDSSVVAFDYRGAVTPTWTTTLQAAYNGDDSHTGGRVIERFRTQREQFTWQNAWKPNANHQVVAAFERVVEKAHSAAFIADEKRDNNAFVLGYSGQFGAHVLQADVRHDDNSVYGGNTTGRLGWSLELLPGLRVRALAGTTYRAPSFNDLFYPGYGVSSVTAEKGRSFEAGLNWRAGDTDASATIYRNRVRNLIGYEPDRSFCPADPAYDFGCARNIGKARLQGATLSAGQRWGSFSLRGTIDFLDAKDEATGQRLARRAAHQESLNADYDVGAWSWGASLLGVGSRPEGTATLASYALLDLKARWRFMPQWQLEAKLLNATDRDYESARFYQSLGRQAWIGIRYDGLGL
jgi:vitamin B12 transporter